MSEAYLDEFLVEAMIELQKKRRHMDEIYRLTKELAEGLSRDDKVTVNILLSMRGEELEAVGDWDVRMSTLVSASTGEEGKLLAALAAGRTPESNAALEGRWQEVSQIASGIKSTWKQIVEIDRVISQRLAGENSYYTE